ncbi:hypothetical protein W02_26200 [Nitrospira sp. KM1]|nr:hypothetical protein W02_26200 [Nitrospira sp. KM1]
MAGNKLRVYVSNEFAEETFGSVPTYGRAELSADNDRHTRIPITDFADEHVENRVRHPPSMLLDVFDLAAGSKK